VALDCSIRGARDLEHSRLLPCLPCFSSKENFLHISASTRYSMNTAVCV
jgi:hypothetical protein